MSCIPISLLIVTQTKTGSRVGIKRARPPELTILSISSATLPTMSPKYLEIRFDLMGILNLLTPSAI